MEYQRDGGGVWGPYHTVAMVFGPGGGGGVSDSAAKPHPASRER